MNKFATFLLIFPSHFLSTSHFEISSDYEQIFRQINDKILATLDCVLFTMRIDENFAKSKNVAERLLIHQFIQNASDINYKIYKDINVLSGAEPRDKKMEYFISINSDLIRNIIKKEWGQLKKITIKRKRDNRTANENDGDENHIRGKNLILDFAHFERQYSKGTDMLITAVVHSTWFAKNSKAKQYEYSKEWEFKDFIKPNSTRRIFDGAETSILKFPFVVSVHIQDQFFCAGSIITKYTVITAASCLRQYYAETSVQPGVPMSIRAGSDYIGRLGVVFPIKELNFHPLFDRDSMDNNLVILRLGRKLTFGQRIRKITIDTKAEMLTENQSILILGWGKRNQSDKKRITGQNLAFAYSNVYNLEECKNIYSRFYVKDKHFCTGLVSKGSGACNNDIGGPAVVGSTLIGIISFGSPHCGRPDAPTVFTKIGYYVEWIRSIVERIKKETDMLRNGSSGSETTPKQTAQIQHNINQEIDSLTQLIGEIQVVNHINSSMNEILREGQTEFALNKQQSNADSPRLVSKKKYLRETTKFIQPLGADRIQNYLKDKLNEDTPSVVVQKENAKNDNEDAVEGLPEVIETDLNNEYEIDNSEEIEMEQSYEVVTTVTDVPKADEKNDDNLLEVVFAKDGTTKMFKRAPKSKVKYVYSV